MIKRIIFATACLAVLAGAAYYGTLKHSSRGADFYFNLRSGMSPNEVSATLGTNFISFEEAKSLIKGHPIDDFDPDIYLRKVGDLVITPDLKKEFETKRAIVPLMGEQAALKASFFKNKLYAIMIEPDLISSEDILKMTTEIQKKLQEKYSDIVSEPSKEVKGAARVIWQKPPVNAVMWSNPRDKILSISYEDDSIFSDETLRQKEKTSNDF